MIRCASALVLFALSGLLDRVLATNHLPSPDPLELEFVAGPLATYAGSNRSTRELV